VTTLRMRLLDDQCHITLLRIRLAPTAGWDVRTDRGELVGHFEDWHRLERMMARLGQAPFAIDSDRRTS